MNRIAVVDYGVGNLHSVLKGVQKAGGDVVLAHTAEDIRQASAIVLPGVGAFRAVAEGFRASGLAEPVLEQIARGTPFLGICVGLQILADDSEEDGPVAGLGLVPGRCIRFRKARKVPHMGWNAVYTVPDCPLFDGIPPGAYFYFVHSYYVVPDDPAVVAGQTEYEGEVFCAALRGTGHLTNVFATQFHPEKSQSDGLRLLANFVQIAKAMQVHG